MKYMVQHTGDGSHTVYDFRTGDTFHSTYGALSESLHIYIRSGFDVVSQRKPFVSILEVGFGTGLNAFLTLKAAHAKGVSVYYMAVEPYPLPEDIIASLNYPLLAGGKEHHHLFRALHSVPPDGMQQINEGFTLDRKHAAIEEIELAPDVFDLVYFDAFGPQFQPAIWRAGIFGKVYQSMATEGVLVTFSCSGAVRRNLSSAGFVVEKIPGPEGKREIIRAFKPE